MKCRIMCGISSGSSVFCKESVRDFKSTKGLGILRKFFKLWQNTLLYAFHIEYETVFLKTNRNMQTPVISDCLPATHHHIKLLFYCHLKHYGPKPYNLPQNCNLCNMPIIRFYLRFRFHPWLPSIR